MTLQSPKGTIDYYPTECAVRNYLFTVFRALSGRYGFKEVESPAFEDIKVLTKKSGEEVMRQIFTLEKKGEEDLGLRFDLTVPLARMFIAKQKELPKPVKWSYCSRMWRYEKPQAGRLREFYQCGVELFGSGKPAADAEVINLVLDFFQTLGLTDKDVELRLNNRKLLEGLLLELVNPDKLAPVIRVIDKKGKINEEEFLRELAAAGAKEPKKILQLLNVADFADLEKMDRNELATEGFNELKAIYPLLQKKFVRLNLSTARGLDYYTGTVFELFDRSGKFRSLCGGGRYDSMVEQFDGQACPATGFSIGLATTTLLLQDRKKLPEMDLGVDYFIAPLDGMEKEAMKIVEKLRQKYRVETDLLQRNLGNQLKYANSIGAKNLIVIGQDEIKKGKVKVKEMATGKEKVIALGKL